jgi:predicted RNA-binding protein with PIN domain
MDGAELVDGPELVNGPERRGRATRRSGGGRSFLRGTAETFGIVAAFVLAGLVAARLASTTSEPPGADGAFPYTLEAMVDEEIREPRVWLVDGFNALHVAVLRGRERAAWWAREGREQILARVRGFDDPSAEIWVVFDGSRPAAVGDGDAERGLRVVFAPSADEWMIRRVRETPGVAVVTADRRLAARARARGAKVVSPRDFLARCGAGDAPRGES